MLLLIDNYDSFTYNIAQAVERMGMEVRVHRNDRITLEQIAGEKPMFLMVSPGPGRPCHAGISVEAVRHFAGKIPILGVCLGHQGIAEAFGGRVVSAPRIMHGKPSLVFHDGRSIYRGLHNPFEAIRYHSLIVERDTLPDCLEVTAWTAEGEVMGIRHKDYPLEGVQFHPESVLTREGPRVFANFLNMEGTTNDESLYC